MRLLAIAGLVFFLSRWLTRYLCRPNAPLSLLDHPNQRSLHHAPTPRTGGLAMLVSSACGVVLAALIHGGEKHSGSFFDATGIWIVSALAVLGAISFCDDRWGLPISLRLSVQVVLAGAVVSKLDLALHPVWIPLFGKLDLGWATWPMTVMFLVWMTNLYNFMDGMDGFAGGMTLIGFGFLAYFAWQGAHSLVFVFSLMIAAAAGGFLLDNFPPARIFLGDIGSIPLGFLAGTLMLLGQRDGLFDVWVPVMIFSPFILDATATLIRRALHGERIWEAHRRHYYQRLVLSGWGHRRTVLTEYILMVCCGIIGWFYWQSDVMERAIILLSWLAIFCVLGASVDVLAHHRIGQEAEK